MEKTQNISTCGEARKTRHIENKLSTLERIVQELWELQQKISESKERFRIEAASS
jgi:hypothetical protein